ncbi:hypothetical protein [Alkalihalobacillus sp. BA299]|uniref:hypothetical protein n=1 Tax=Alkalihalobacillus sp. BA299 TaxID=2815938 RepID=UPI001ADC43B6|nr:hypothetical protein [Alkalihalobacillus sp. BA299]
MPINRPAVPKPENVQLGEGVLIFNFNPDDWDDVNATAFGAVRGGGSYNIEPTNKPIRFAGDRGEDTKGLKRRTEFKITISASALELDHAKLQKFMPGTVTNTAATTNVPSYNKFRPNTDFADTDYIGNLAYITSNKNGDIVAYVIENVLGDGAFTAAMTDKDEIVSEVTFTAHFDPNDMDKVPAYIVQYTGDVATA